MLFTVGQILMGTFLERKHGARSTNLIPLSSASQLREPEMLTFHPLISLITVAMAAWRAEKANKICYRAANFRGGSQNDEMKALTEKTINGFGSDDTRRRHTK